MPALAFGLKPAKGAAQAPKQPPKRKAAFDDADEKEDEGDDGGVFGALQKPKSKSLGNSSSIDRPRKSPKLSEDRPNVGQDSSKYTNLSALRNARLQDEKASQVDASVYDYDEVYETFSADKEKKKAAEGGTTVPKYMTNLLASAEVRKRDQLKAKEKALQKERDAEGDAFADKEKFVTGAYKQQQEEMRKMEEEEKKREELEEERRRKGAGMTAFHKELLQKDEERQRAVEEATRIAQARKAEAELNAAADGEESEEKSEAKLAAELNEHGAKVVVNDDGEIVDKRQLLTAGLNVAPKKPGSNLGADKASAAAPKDWQRSTKQQDARMAQRERQSRMMERQLEEITAKQNEAELAEKKELEDKNKSKLTEDAKLSAKERYLQRKKEREEEAKKAKAGAD
ncbi:hypothetical protein ES702_00224 [subsurface metagenome]